LSSSQSTRKTVATKQVRATQRVNGKTLSARAPLSENIGKASPHSQAYNAEGIEMSLIIRLMPSALEFSQSDSKDQGRQHQGLLTLFPHGSNRTHEADRL